MVTEKADSQGKQLNLGWVYMKSVKDIEIYGKRVLVRVDYNLPMDEKSDITDDTIILCKGCRETDCNNDPSKCIILVCGRKLLLFLFYV